MTFIRVWDGFMRVWDDGAGTHHGAAHFRPQPS